MKHYMFNVYGGKEVRQFPILAVPEGASRQVVKIARHNYGALGVNSKGTVYLLSGSLPSEHGGYTRPRESIVKALLQLGVISDSEYDACLNKGRRDGRQHQRKMSAYRLQAAARELGVELSKTQQKRAGLL